MRFRTEVEIPDFGLKINYKSKIFFVGSCFSDNIGGKFKSLFFRTLVNPFGVLYNPFSVAKSLEFLINKKKFDDNDLIFYSGLWHSFSHHGSFSHINKDIVLKNINENIDIGSDFLQAGEFLFITFGTAWVYRYKKTNEIVSNCHKIPAKEFERNLLKISEIIDVFDSLLNVLSVFNKNLKIIFTVSPVRHLKDGAHGNQISKSTLLLAIDELQKKFKNVYYFPSYEILIDELRDYRFYNADMTHISSVAIDYVWEKIVRAFFDKKTEEELNIAKKIYSAMQHKILQSNKFAVEKFLENTQHLIEKLKQLNNKIDLASAEDWLNEQKKLL
jgi:hypothetical protein